MSRDWDRKGRQELPGYNLRRFAHPSIFRSVSPTVLWEFLAPHKHFLKSKDLELPDECQEMSDPDYLMLTSILMNPDESMPPDLTDALFFTHEMASDQAMDDLLEVASGIGLSIGDEVTVLDVAMRIWLADRTALEKKHSQQHITRTRTFEHYRADGPVAFHEPQPERVAEMKGSMNEWFIKHKRGGNCELFIYPGAEEIWFLVRHGDPYKRESAVQGEKSKGILYRPEVFDVICYVPMPGEIRIHAKTKGEKDLYRREFGKLIAESPSHFPGLDKYTLDPLINDGDRSLVCTDIEGIDWILLRELHVRKSAIHFKYSVVYKDSNVFAILRHRNESLGRGDVLVKAVFSVKFAGEDKARAVTIVPTNKIRLARDSDGEVVEHWLRARGFAAGSVEERVEESGEFLVGV